MAINLREIFTALVSKGVMKYYDHTYTIPVPPYSTIEFEREVDEDSVSLVSEERYAIDTDDALEIQVEIDGVVRGYNYDVKQQTYSTPTNWMDIGAFTPIYKKLRVIITNTTGSIVNITVTSRYGVVLKSYYDRLIDSYFSNILGVVGHG